MHAKKHHQKHQCSLVKRDRSGVKILPPNENSLSTDALDAQCSESHIVSLYTDTPSGYLALLHHHEKCVDFLTWIVRTLSLFTLLCLSFRSKQREKVLIICSGGDTCIVVAEPEPDSEAAEVDA